MRRLIWAGLLVVAPLLSPVGASTASAATFVYQDVPLAPFTDSTTQIVNGTFVDGACVFDVPTVAVPASAPRWEVRAVGIDPANCRELVEQGIPPSATPGSAAASLAAVVDTATPSAAAGSRVASGYTSAWYEDLAGIHVTQDTTYVSWSYNGTCASGMSTSGQWSWDSLFSLVTHGGATYQYCAYGIGNTWSSMKSTCPVPPFTTVWTYYNHVETFGWYDGSVSASVDQSWNQDYCPLPLFPHWSYAKTG